MRRTRRQQRQSPRCELSIVRTDPFTTPLPSGGHPPGRDDGHALAEPPKKPRNALDTPSRRQRVAANDPDAKAILPEPRSVKSKFLSVMSLMKNPNSIFHRLLHFGAVVCSLGVSTFAWANPPEGVLDLNHASVKSVVAVQNAVTKNLMTIPEILGTAVGQDAQGQLALVIYVNSESQNAGEVVRALPKSMRGASVSVELTEPFRALQRFQPMDGGAGHKVKQTSPISLGTSGGWQEDLANGYCCGGTLGSLVQVNGVQYILSNYHVLESDIVNGGNGITAQTGDNVIQPGLIDVSCNANNAQNVATLVKTSSLPGSNVDAAIAQVISGMVRTDGAIIDIGTISATTVAASLSQAVKKSGRTTGLTTSTVSGLNATVSGAYDNECAGGAAFTKTFTGQIVIKNKSRGQSFIAGGDSGSLMVQNVTTNPKAVGLLFAGSSTSAIANPIGQVLSYIGGVVGGTATMVGN